MQGLCEPYHFCNILRFAQNTMPSAKGVITNLSERISYPETSYDLCKFSGICSVVVEVSVLLERSAESLGDQRLRFLNRGPVRSPKSSLINYPVMWSQIPEDPRPLLTSYVFLPSLCVTWNGTGEALQRRPEECERYNTLSGWHPAKSFASQFSPQ